MRYWAGDSRDTTATRRAFASAVSCDTSLRNKVSGGPSIDSKATVVAPKPVAPKPVEPKPAPKTGCPSVVQPATMRPQPVMTSAACAIRRKASHPPAPYRYVSRNIANPCRRGRPIYGSWMPERAARPTAWLLRFRCEVQEFRRNYSGRLVARMERTRDPGTAVAHGGVPALRAETRLSMRATPFLFDRLRIDRRAGGAGDHQRRAAEE